jgi:hypothetical protein
VSSDPNDLQNAEAQKQIAAGHAQELRQRTNEVMEALKYLTEDDCKGILDEVLTALHPHLRRIWDESRSGYDPVSPPAFGRCGRR